MKNFIFKSTEADLQKMFQYLETAQRNILYITHQVDFIRKRLVALETDKALQTQVDEYFEHDPFGSAFNEAQKHAPQTDSDNKIEE